MEEQFVPYELALKLMQLDFDELCLTSYTKAGLFIHPFDIKSELEEDNVILDSLYLKNSEMHFDYVSAPLWQQAFSYLFKLSNGKINISIDGEDNYESLFKKLEQATKDFRNI